MKKICINVWKKVSDAEYIAGLKRGDNYITEMFFYGLCNYLLNDIKFSLMKGNIDYDALVSELFIYLSKDNWHKLETFSGVNGCSLITWVTTIAWRFFFKYRERLLFVDRNCADCEEMSLAADNLSTEIVMDVNTTFDRMPNKRYVKILKWMFVEGYNAEEVAAKLNTTIPNVYNIKHRAIIQFVEVFNMS